MDIPPHERETRGPHGARVGYQQTPGPEANLRPWFRFHYSSANSLTRQTIADEASAYLLGRTVDVSSLGPLFEAEEPVNRRLIPGEPSPNSLWV